MENKKSFKRRIIQLYCALLYNANLLGYKNGKIYHGKLKAVCALGLNCYSCPAASFACPLGALQNAFVASKVRLPFYMLGIICLYGLILGRKICGYLCPFGLLQDLLHKIPSKKVEKNKWTRKLSLLKYIILLIIVIIIPLIYFIPAFCKHICPVGSLEGGILLLLNPANKGLRGQIGNTFIWKVSLLGVIFLICIFIYRAFCRFLCPLGAIYGLFNKICFFNIKVDKPLCTKCNACIAICPMDIKEVGDRECIHCGKCQSVCHKKAIKNNEIFKEGKIRRIILVLLLTIVLMVTFITSSKEKVNEGYKVGEKFPNVVLGLSDKEYYLNEVKGKIIIINFWATWCEPCVEELRDFEKLQQENDVEIFILNVDEASEEVDKWIKENNVVLTYGYDNGLLAEFTNQNVLPFTIIINQEGIITYAQEGKIVYEKMLELIDNN